MIMDTGNIFYFNLSMHKTIPVDIMSRIMVKEPWHWRCLKWCPLILVYQSVTIILPSGFQLGISR